MSFCVFAFLRFCFSRFRDSNNTAYWSLWASVRRQSSQLTQPLGPNSPRSTRTKDHFRYNVAATNWVSPPKKIKINTDTPPQPIPALPLSLERNKIKTEPAKKHGFHPLPWVRESEATAAVEAHLKGHEVVVLEKAKSNGSQLALEVP